MKPNLADIIKVTAGKTKTTGISPFSELEISKVYPNPDQPRKQFDDIEELASTIKEHGLLQPITVVKKDDGYMIISGERRYKAHLHNEAKTIKAHIVNVSDEAVEELTLIENIQRNDLTDFETAKHIVKLWESGRYEKKSDLAKKIGKSDSYVSKAFSCLKLDDEILEDIEQNKKDISVSVMDEISRVKDKEVQKEVYKKYSNKEITRDEIKEFKEPKKKDEKRNLLPNFIYYEPLKYEDGTTLQSEFIDKNLPFKDINTIGQGAYGNKGFYNFNDIGATFGFVGLKIGDYCIESNPNEKYSLSITKVELPEDEVLLENELSVIGEVHPESFSCIEFKKIKAYFYYSTLKNPDNFQGFRKGEKYKLVLRKIETKEENISSKNFPRGNLKKFELEIFGQDGLLYESDIIEASNDNQALKKAYEKYPDTAKDDYYNFFVTEIEYNIAQEKQKFISTSKNTEDNKSISFEDEGFFYFVNYGSGAKKSFKLGKKYKITIEEI